MNNDSNNEYLKKKRKVQHENNEIDRLKYSTHFEKNDFLALLIAAFTTILPFALFMFLAVYFLTRFILKI